MRGIYVKDDKDYRKILHFMQRIEQWELCLVKAGGDFV